MPEEFLEGRFGGVCFGGLGFGGLRVQGLGLRGLGLRGLSLEGLGLGCLNTVEARKLEHHYPHALKVK